MSPISKENIKSLKSTASGRSSAVDYVGLAKEIEKQSKTLFKSDKTADEAIFSKDEFNVVLQGFTTRPAEEYYKPEEGLVFSKERIRGICLTLEEDYENITYNKYPKFGRLIAVHKNGPEEKPVKETSS